MYINFSILYDIYRWHGQRLKQEIDTLTDYFENEVGLTNGIESEK